jgi:mRNA-degrading endonuclease toxin of MazEF toxin-antitoxin module
MALPVQGGIYYVDERWLNLPPESERIVHDARRPFLVLSGNATNSESTWRTVSGCPISGSTTYRTRFDVKFSAGEWGLTKKCWLRVHALQPVMKADLEDQLGLIDNVRLEEVQARVLQHLGLLPDT